MKQQYCVGDLLSADPEEHENLELECLEGHLGLTNRIVVPDINRPGLALTGYYENFGGDRIQLFGLGETAYLQMLERKHKYAQILEFFKHAVLCIIFSHSITPTETILKGGREYSCPVLRTELPTSEFSMRLTRTLAHWFSMRKVLHGVMVEVFGIGILLMGESGVGKSEAALELVERGHRLVADDAVEVRNVAGHILLGKRPDNSPGHYMEIRGLGVINIAHLFGVGAVREQKHIQLVLDLQEWDAQREYERIGSERAMIESAGRGGCSRLQDTGAAWAKCSYSYRDCGNERAPEENRP